MHRSHPNMVVRKYRPKKPRALNTAPYEATDQAKVCQWLDKHQLLYFSIPNDGDRSIAMAAKARATGLKRGVPDLCIPMPRAPYHGLYIEMKRLIGGTVDENQRYWNQVLRSQGYRAEICKGYDAAIRVLRDYFNL